MLQVRDITKWFGDVKVLDRINFNLNRGDRAGLIGPNGCGKTTLLKIITGELAPDRGSVQRSPAGIRLGYLPQALDFPPGATVGDVLRSALGEREAAETRLDHLAEAVAAARDDALPAALAAYDRALAEFQALGGARAGGRRRRRARGPGHARRGSIPAGDRAQRRAEDAPGAGAPAPGPAGPAPAG